MKYLRNFALAATVFVVINTENALAHPHVFVDANMELLRDNSGRFTEIRHVWQFDELFSASLVLDFDENDNNVLDKDEIAKITAIIKDSIAEYDYYTAVRYDGQAVELYAPETLSAYHEDGHFMVFFSLEIIKPVKPEGKPLKISTSDTSFYVAFDFQKDNITIDTNPSGCNIGIEYPDLDSLFSQNMMTLSESFFNNPDNTNSLDDAYYTWVSVNCP